MVRAELVQDLRTLLEVCSSDQGDVEVVRCSLGSLKGRLCGSSDLDVGLIAVGMQKPAILVGSPAATCPVFAV